MITKAPPGHSYIETADGSLTLYSEKFQEACHSTSGALAETLLHYVEGCKILERSQHFSPLMILEVGFGLGVGFLTTLSKMPPNVKWIFVSLELDQNLLQWFKDLHPELHLRWENNLLISESDDFKLIIIQGDARTSLPDFLRSQPMKFHAIYQDAFSPKRGEKLWTKQWFSILKSCSHEEVILSTYSASISIRKSLHESGWGVQKGESFGTKRTSTRAVLNRETDPAILSQLDHSPTKALVDSEEGLCPT
jgi:tRNA U34 5-methylaminomethyl-2-thiouridine-forming methyltransferase MnmC